MLPVHSTRGVSDLSLFWGWTEEVSLSSHMVNSFILTQQFGLILPSELSLQGRSNYVIVALPNLSGNMLGVSHHARFWGHTDDKIQALLHIASQTC